MHDVTNDKSLHAGEGVGEGEWNFQPVAILAQGLFLLLSGTVVELVSTFQPLSL